MSLRLLIGLSSELKVMHIICLTFFVYSLSSQLNTDLPTS